MFGVIREGAEQIRLVAPSCDGFVVLVQVDECPSQQHDHVVVDGHKLKSKVLFQDDWGFNHAPLRVFHILGDPLSLLPAVEASKRAEENIVVLS